MTDQLEYNDDADEMSLDDIALALAQGLCATGMPADAACGSAWLVGVPAFIRGKRQFESMANAMSGLSNEEV